MAKSKVKNKKKSKPKTLAKRINSMAKRKVKKKTGSAIRRTMTRKAAPKKRRVKKKGLFDSGNKGGLMFALKHTGLGGLGGASLLATRLIELNKWVRVAIGFGTAGMLSMARNESIKTIGAGLAGATAYQLLGSLAPAGMLLNDGDFEDADYVDRDTLSETDLEDEYGNPVLMADNGNVYALNENNELEEIGDVYSLQDELNDMQNQSMVPLYDNDYSLAANY